MHPRGRDWSDWRIREPQNLVEFNYVFMRKGFEDKPMFAAQNCMYIQAVGGNMLRTKRQEAATSMRQRAARTLRSW